MHTTSLHLCMKKIKSITQSRKDAEEQPKIDLNLFISILPLCAFASLREKKNIKSSHYIPHNISAAFIIVSSVFAKQNRNTL